MPHPVAQGLSALTGVPLGLITGNGLADSGGVLWKYQRVLKMAMGFTILPAHLEQTNSF